MGKSDEYDAVYKKHNILWLILAKKKKKLKNVNKCNHIKCNQKNTSKHNWIWNVFT